MSRTNSRAIVTTFPSDEEYQENNEPQLVDLQNQFQQNLVKWRPPTGHISRGLPRTKDEVLV